MSQLRPNTSSITTAAAHQTLLEDDSMDTTDEASPDCEMVCVEDVPETHPALELGNFRETCNNGIPVSLINHTKSEVAQCMRPVDFLEVCFLCERSLGQGRDIFMYRGDRAFCSVECRYYQMAADQRRDKCAATAVKKGGAGAAAAVNCSCKNQAVSTETAAAA